MLKLLTAGVLAAVLTAIGVTAAVDHRETEDSSDRWRLTETFVCEEVVVTAERPSWLIEEVVVVSEKPNPAPGDSSLQSPWLRETEMATKQPSLPTATN
jgi:hypothetical protein